MTLKEFKKEFDPLVNECIDDKIKNLPQGKDFKFIKVQFDFLKNFIKGGKRIRPFIAYLSYINFKEKNSKDILKLLVFLELFHYFCLIHDDIMDNSEKRHGVNTLHKEFGNSNAILIGDYLFSWSWEILNKSDIDPKLSLHLREIFSEMIAEVFLGQAIDINLDSRSKISNALILKKTLLKTAGYTFTKPMLIGLLLSENYNSKNINLIEKLGENLGLAFQIQDDLLDITSNFDGKKKPLSDIEEGKHTLITNYVFENGTISQKEKLKKTFGHKIENVDEAKEIFDESGAINFAEKLICNYYEASKNLVKNNKDFLEFINLLENRKS